MLKKKATIINLILVLLGFLSLSIWLIRELVGCGYRWPPLALWMASHETLVFWLFTVFLLGLLFLVIFLIFKMPKTNVWAGIGLFLTVFFLTGTVAIGYNFTGFRGCFSEPRMKADIAKIVVLEKYHLFKFGSLASSIEDLELRNLLSRPWSYFIRFQESDERDLSNMVVEARFNNKVIFECNNTLSKCSSFLR